MLTRLANLGIRAPRRVLGLAGLLLVLAAIYGVGAASHLSSGGFSDPTAPSSRAADVLQHDASTPATPTSILEVNAPGGATSAAARAVGLRRRRARSARAAHQPGRCRTGRRRARRPPGC